MVIALRKMALRLLPLFVAVLVIHAVSGWVEHLPAHGVVEEDAAYTVGLAICGATVAALLAAVRRSRDPRPPAVRPPRRANRRAIHHPSYAGAPVPAAPLRKTLQVFRN